MDILLFATPVFMLFVGIEAAIAHARRRPLYRLNDFVSGLSCGMLDQVVNVSVIAVFLVVYAAVQRWQPWWTFAPDSVLAWLLLFVGHDLCYYAFHRASHRVNVLWATHIVHHQSEEYNFTVSLRQGTVATWLTYVFYLPLALAGFPVSMFLIVHGLYQVYQFFVHTRLVGTLGPLEWVFATPSVHRVHHGRTAECLDKNYGGFLNVWDRLFGSFQPEEREPEYGITTGISSWSPYWANLHYFAHLVQCSRTAPDVTAAVKVWLAPPEWKMPWVAGAPPIPHYDAQPPPAWAPYLLTQLGLALLGGWLVLLTRDSLSVAAVWILSGAVLATLLGVAGFFDGKAWAPASELVRNGVVAVVFITLGASGTLPAWAATAGVAVSLLSLGACVWLMSRR